MKETSIAFALFALATVGFTQEKTKVTISPKADVATKYKVDIAMTVGGMDVTVKSDLTNKITKVEDGKYGTETTWTNLKIALSGAEMEGITADPVVAKFDLKGDLLELSGGIQGTDAVQMHLLSIFVPPTGELAKDEKSTVEFAGNADKTIPARKYEITALGKETLAGKDALKYSIKFSTKETGGLTFDATYWVTAEGTVLKGEGKFANLFIPQAGAGADGTFKFESA